MATRAGTTPDQYRGPTGFDRPEVLIEQWLPVDVIGAESMRERGASSALPPLYFLHVWWSRKPLIASRAAVLASLLPAWSASWPDDLRRRFPDNESYRRWFLELCGILGDPIAGRKLIAWAKERGVVLKGGPYTHKRAFTVNAGGEHRATLDRLLAITWGTSSLTVLDPFAGGGSIPFEAQRYGFRSHANELNPVASVLLKATLEYPAVFGPSLRDDIVKYGSRLAERIGKRLLPFYSAEPTESIHAYIWTRTVACPYTGKPIPLVPNWWLQRGANPVAIRPSFPATADAPRLEIVSGTAAVAANPDKGTIVRGNATSPWSHGQIVDGDYIKGEARAGRMGHMLYAVAVKDHRGLRYRSPRDDEMASIDEARAELARRLPLWEAEGTVPTEDIPEGIKSGEPRRYGMFRWMDLFSPRQLLAFGTFVEEYRTLLAELRSELPEERAKAVATYLALVLDKAADYNALLATWENTRQVVKHVFKQHGFAFSWNYGEFDAARNLFPWALSQVADAYRDIARLAATSPDLLESATDRHAVRVTNENASRLTVDSGSVAAIVVDPPYEASIIYSELSDFFYVWLKRTAGLVHPEFFVAELVNRDDEVVKNVGRFVAVGKKKDELAQADFERKLTASFREMHRVLRDDGVLTVMFTHKKVAAWDNLAMSLIDAGFTIHSSWPVHTESENSLHQARKNAAQSTILLSCRKREARAEPVWWDDLKGRVRHVAREKAMEFEVQGIRGVDLYIATFGPTLAILSENWPVLTSEVDDRTGEPKPLRPEVALELARQEVVNLRKRGLLLGRMVQFDQYTDWYLMAWDAFRAEQFPADEARKLAIALGLDLERQVIAEKRLVSKKASSVVLQKPDARRGTARVDADRETFEHVVDAVHTAMWVFEEDGAAACESFLRQTGLRDESAFKACVQAMLNAIPRTKQKGKFVRPEAEVLEGMRLAFFDDLIVPVEDEVKVVEEQLQLLGGGPAGAEEELDEEGDEDEDEEA